MEGFSKYFTFEALTSTSHQSQLYRNREESRPFIKSGQRLSMLLEEIRELLGGRPIKVSSGFRGVTLNRSVGGSEKSKHLKFEAADVIPTHLSVEEAFNIIKKNKDDFTNLRRVIIEKVGGKEWLHIEAKTDQNEKQVFASIGEDRKYKVVG